MKQPFYLTSLLAALLAPAALRADIQVIVSVKAILDSNGNWPSNTNTIGSTGVNLNSEQAVRDNIALTNTQLAAKGYPFRLSLRSNTVYTLSGFANSWFTGDARTAAFRDSIEAAATASDATKTTWKWHDDAINIFLNDSRSGFCSSPGSSRRTITVGAGAYDELIMHEIGHFLSLAHTHSGDGDGDLNDWADGDGFDETLADDADATASDINARYPAETQATRDNLIFNRMSYHSPQDVFVWDQLQAIVETVNGARDPECRGEGFFVRSNGSDTSNGRTYATRVATMARAAALSTSGNDVILIQGTINVPNGSVFSKPGVWTKWRSTAVLE
ncbi:MAG: hypothetical protein K9N23_20750 [Akkermansiaceae bacterium]|nr:hypothetical protein [Akkermansiaceae bacterium]